MLVELPKVVDFPFVHQPVRVNYLSLVLKLLQVDVSYMVDSRSFGVIIIPIFTVNSVLTLVHVEFEYLPILL